MIIGRTPRDRERIRIAGTPMAVDCRSARAKGRGRRGISTCAGVTWPGNKSTPKRLAGAASISTEGTARRFFTRVYVRDATGEFKLVSNAGSEIDRSLLLKVGNHR
jgi:hypothetical protein